MKQSNLELLFKTQIEDAGILDFKTEYRFDKERKWRWDFAWLDIQLAVEIQGGIYSGGRHTTGKGYEKDCEKYARGIELGWTILQIPGTWVTNSLNGLDTTKRILSVLRDRMQRSRNGARSRKSARGAHFI